MREKIYFEESLEKDLGRIVKIEIEGIIESYQSKFQKIDIYQTKPFGKMLTLDDVIMLTEYDEFAYHEMITHVPMFTHPHPRNICVIGGGDGGTIREILKHSSVENIDICEIDEDVIRLCRKHLSNIACGYNDKKVHIFTEDGAKFISKRKNYYDIIIVDSSDPIGFCEVLFSEKFYKNMSEALKENGIAVTQSESLYYYSDIVKKLSDYAKKYFWLVSYYFTLVPTYPSGTIGFTFCSKRYHPIFELREQNKIDLSKFKYYNPYIHKGAFGLPNCILK